MESASSPINIALLIDAENAPSSKIDFIISEMASHGRLSIRKAFGNWKKPALQGWEAVLHEYAIQPIHLLDMVPGKNGSDMALIIEAMDILYSKPVGTFCIVSSDCDFTPLVLRLRAEGKQVIGFGEKKTPEPFVNSCNKFLILTEKRKPSDARSDKLQEPKQTLPEPKLILMLRNAVRAHEGEEGWAHLGVVGSHISNQGPFDPRNYGFSKLSDLFASLDAFEVRKNLSENGGVTSIEVRCRSSPGPISLTPLAAISPEPSPAPEQAPSAETFPF